MATPTSSFGYFPEYTGVQMAGLNGVDTMAVESGSGLKYDATKKQWVATTKGTVTQLVSTTEGVTLNADSGKITCFASTLASGIATEDFVLTNDKILADSIVLVSVVDYSSANQGTGTVTVASKSVSAGSCTISVGNTSSAALDGQVNVGFTIL